MQDILCMGNHVGGLFEKYIGQHKHLTESGVPLVGYSA